MGETHFPLYGKTVQSSLERQFIREYLQAQGYSTLGVQKLPLHRKRELMTAASCYASLKLAEIEACSRFIDKIHRGG